MTEQKKSSSCRGGCITRREALLGGAGVITSTVLLSTLPGCEKSEPVPVQVSRHPGKLIGKLSELKQNQSVPFSFPEGAANATGMLIKMGVQAGGGIGPEQDIVAFNTTCPHMGGQLYGRYIPEEQALGACPHHLSSFDLTRHGMVIAGHATESLPQVLLELDGDDIYAVGLIGLIYGHTSNPEA